MLRRQKDQILNGKPLMELPKRTVNVVSCDFDPFEKSFYDSLESKMESVIQKLMASSKGNSYFSVLLLLLRLRQGTVINLFCDKSLTCSFVKPAIIPSLSQRTIRRTWMRLIPRPLRRVKTSKTLTAMISPLLLARWALHVNAKCAPRSKRYNLRFMSNLNLNNTRLRHDNTGADGWNTHCRGCVPLAKEAQRAERDRPSSAKIRKILQLLKEIEERSEGVEKTIIFSQFTSMLDLIEPFLSEKGIKYVRCELVLLESVLCNF